jgi:hypothetical protein
MFLPLWNALVIVFAFFSCRKVRRRRTDDESIPTTLGNLGDVQVQVQVQVDVNVEKGWTSIAAS